MIADSIKFRGHRCFKNEFVGIDEIKLINVIIGRNNTGKSHLLDIVEQLCKDPPSHKPEPILMRGWHNASHGTIYGAELNAAFESNTYYGAPPIDMNLEENIGISVIWENNNQGEITKLLLPDSFDITDTEYKDPDIRSFIKESRLDRIHRILTRATNQFGEKIFRRLLADRDIQPEPRTPAMTLSSHGRGATNIIRRHLHSASISFPSERVRKRLREALNAIFVSDGIFIHIASKVHERDDASDRSPELWEIYLEEAKKGEVSLSNSGSGLKTIILVLLNLLVVPDIDGNTPNQYVFAFEELENKLHPALLRRLLKYIEAYALEHQTPIFLTTHSSVALDVFGPSPHAQFIHVTHDGESARTTTVKAHFDHLNVISELGAKPSDLLQANGIIWVEGPSDRIYINRWIELYTWDEETNQPKFREGRDYQCAFYGGSLLAGTQFTAPEEARQEFVNLLRVNPHIAVMCDSDQADADADLKDRVLRVSEEVEKIPRAHLWVGAAREVENYLSGTVIGQALKMKVMPPDPGQHESFFPRESGAADSYIETKLKRKTMDKMKLASLSSPFLTFESMEHRFDWSTQMQKLTACIESWNK